MKCSRGINTYEGKSEKCGGERKKELKYKDTAEKHHMAKDGQGDKEIMIWLAERTVAASVVYSTAAE